MARSLSSDSREFAVLPGAVIFLSLNFATIIGSKSAKTSLHKGTCHKREGKAQAWKQDTKFIETVPEYVPFAENGRPCKFGQSTRKDQKFKQFPAYSQEYKANRENCQIEPYLGS